MASKSCPAPPSAMSCSEQRIQGHTTPPPRPVRGAAAMPGATTRAPLPCPRPLRSCSCTRTTSTPSSPGQTSRLRSRPRSSSRRAATTCWTRPGCGARGRLGRWSRGRGRRLPPSACSWGVLALQRACAARGPRMTCLLASPQCAAQRHPLPRAHRRTPPGPPARASTWIPPLPPLIAAPSSPPPQIEGEFPDLLPIRESLVKYVFEPNAKKVRAAPRAVCTPRQARCASRRTAAPAPPAWQEGTHCPPPCSRPPPSRFFSLTPALLAPMPPCPPTVAGRGACGCARDARPVKPKRPVRGSRSGGSGQPFDCRSIAQHDTCLASSPVEIARQVAPLLHRPRALAQFSRACMPPALHAAYPGPLHCHTHCCQ